MRITQFLTFNNMKIHLERNREELAKYQHQLSSGKSVIKASDDYVSFNTSRKIQHYIRRDQQYQNNVNSGLRQARTAQEALEGMIDMMIDLKEVAVTGANDSLDASERESLADQVSHIRDRMIDLGNSSLDGVYMFGGTNSGEPTFSKDPAGEGGVADISNGTALTTSISENSTVATSVTGDELRNTPGGDLFELFETIEDALRNNDRETVSNNLDAIEGALGHVTNLTSRTGSTISRMEFVHERLEGGMIAKEGEVSRLTDTDVAEAISNFQKLETAYEAALTAHSRMTQISLLNYL